MTAKGFFLTFPQAADVVLTDLFENFRDNWVHQATGRRPIDVLVAKELHQDGTPHFHCFLRFEQRIDILANNVFDYNGHHPNIQAARSPKHVIQYCVKEGDFLATFNVPVKKSVKQLLDECSNAEEFIDKALAEGSGWNNARAFTSIKAMAQHHYRNKNLTSKVCEPVFNITTFINIPDQVVEFIHTLGERQPGGRDRAKSLWLWGRSRLGKTALAQSLGKHTRIANVWNFELVDSTGLAQYLILDDISWESWKYQFKTLLGCQRDVVFSGKYQKPTSFVFGIPAVVLSNTLPEFTREESEWLAENVSFVLIDVALFNST